MFYNMNICNILFLTYFCMLSLHTQWKGENTAAKVICTSMHGSCIQPNTDFPDSWSIMSYILPSVIALCRCFGKEEKVYIKDLFGFEVL